VGEPVATMEQNALNPDEALQLLEQREQSAQRELAERTDAGTDVLHYLAQNGAAATRRAVAANPAASAESNRLLADDPEDGVRLALAQKIGRLFPSLLDVEQKHLRDLTLETLERLSQDVLPRVRAMLAREIKHLDCVPKAVVQRLARDAEEIVAAPIIEHSPLLEDADLIEIVAAAQANSVLTAVARRKGLSADVADAVAATFDVSAVAALLSNTDASIRTRTMDQIVAQAAEVAEWHGPLVLRAELSPGAIRRISSFVASALIDTLTQRAGLDDATRTHLRQTFEDRRKAEVRRGAEAVDAAQRSGTLNEAFVTDAVETLQKETVVRALSALTGTDEALVRRVLESGSAKAATALAWRAGLSMRVAFKIQTSVMHLSGRDLLPARGGIDFPLTEDEMRWHLGYFEVNQLPPRPKAVLKH
jgi:uncharacterized protein (DUF2336 family)